MKKQTKKAFTLVELLVVIAILAILGTVSIVGYTSFTTKAKLSNDETLVEEWNTLLTGNEVLDGKFTTSTSVRSFFIENGSTIKEFTPTSTGYHFYWNQDDNRMYLIDSKTQKAIYPVNDLINSPIASAFNVNYLCFTANEANSSVTPNFSSGTYEYSIDGVNWLEGKTYDPMASSPDKTTINLANIGDKVYLRGKGCTTEPKYIPNGKGLPLVITYKFEFINNISSSGSVTSLIDENGINPNVELSNYVFSNMFNGASTLLTAPELPATSLSRNCYERMFEGCTSLVTAPELPATTLANSCYFNMFKGCSALTKAPELPATNLVNMCYYSMFQDCSALTTAPTLPVTTMKKECYGFMFAYCLALTKAPELPATTLAESCYQSMFMNCTSLTETPKLPATTLETKCYSGMFENCKSFKVNDSVPSSNSYGMIFTVTSDNACSEMFKDTAGSFTGTPELNKTYYWYK